MKFILALAALGMGFVVYSVSVASGPKTIVGKAVPQNQQVSMDEIDHGVWDQLLQKYVDEKGQVNYQALNASEADSQQLDLYLDTLATASTDLEASRDAQLAFWINAYNAVTVKGILREYPTTSIRNHTSKLGGYNIWHDLLLNVGSIQISLDSIEHQVLRKMSEPRVHFAIVCASYSCPRLLNRAYTAEALEEQLVLNTKDFFANEGNFQFDAERGQFRLSSIIKWFAKDFGANKAQRLASIAPYLPTQESYQAAINNQVRVSYLEYDWSLNEQKSAPGSSRR